MKKKHLFQSGLALFVCLFLFAGAVFAQTQTEVVQVKSNQTWTVPTDVQVTSVTFEAWGGGGAGGYSWTPFLITPAGGGGGAAYAKSATITDLTPGEQFTIVVGSGGTAVGTSQSNFTVTHGGISAVERDNNSSMVVLAVGGKSVEGVSTLTGAAGGNKNECIGAVKNSGGNGGNADKGVLNTGAYCVSGSGGGAGGPGGDGTNANNSTYNLNPFSDIPLGQTTGYPGQGNGGFAGNGAWGKESQIIGSGGWGNAQGDDGGNYGGGGAGAISNGVSWGDANGGKGGDGIVIITYTYTDQTIEVADVEKYLCTTPAAPSTNHTNYSLPLNVQVTGFQLKDAHPSIDYANISAQTGLDYSTPTITYNTSEGRWYINGSFRNNDNSNTLTLTIPVTFLTENWMVWDESTVTIHAYPRLNGGVIAKDQFVCGDQEIDILKGDGSVVTDPDYGNLTTAEASGGSGAGTYQWYAYDNINGYDYQPITGANANNYTPSNGYYLFEREYVDEACGSAWAANAYFVGDYYIVVITVNPLELTETGFSEDTICSNEPYTHTLDFSGTSPAAYWFNGYILQESLDKGATWTNAGSDQDIISLTPDDLTPGSDIWYRFAYVFDECDPYPGNSIHKIHVKEVPDYTDQFEDETITLWYGACDTNIANMTPPTLTPTPADIAGPFCAQGLRLAPGTYTITWTVKPDEDCEIYDTYEQQLTVEFPKCGTLDEPYIVKDRYGNEYNTIRIGCDCWFAENLRSNADNATYYDDDEANEAFGKLYNWNDAVGSFNTEMETKLGTTYIQGVCPMGWAIPTVAQYNTMMSNVDGTDAIKSDDQSTWLPGNAGTNAAGFAAMGAGYYEAMQYQRMLGYTYFWTADLNESNNTVAKVMELRCGCDQLTCTEKNKEAKVSLRCVKVEPLSYININIAFDMNDSWGDGWNGAYLLAEYGSSSVKLFLDREHGTHFENTLPVPQGSDVTLTWSSAWFDNEISITVTNEETEEVIYHVEDLSSAADGEVLTNFHVDGACNPEDLQLVDFVLKSVWSEAWDNGSFSNPQTGFLQVDYGTGVLNLTKQGSDVEHAMIALPVGAHIQLNWVGYTTGCYFTVQYPDGTVIYDATTVDEGPLYEFDVEKQ